MGCSLHYGISDNFRIDPAKHDRQFNHIYYCRLCELYEPIKRNMRSDIGIKKIVDLKIGEDCQIIGIIILDRSNGAKKIYIEDDSAKICVSDLNVPFIVTGLCVGISGRLSSDAIFIANDIILPGIPVKSPIVPSQTTAILASGVTSDFDMDIILELCRKVPADDVHFKPMNNFSPISCFCWDHYYLIAILICPLAAIRYI